MLLASVALSVAMSATAVPPGELVVDHTQPYHWGQPIVRVFERHSDDLERRTAWEAYNLELKELWRAYRKTGSTPEAWDEYKKAAGQAKRRYIFGDKYLTPIVSANYFEP